MPRQKVRWVTMLLVTMVVGCQSVPTSQVQNFVSATNALAQAESDYFDQLQAASDNSHILIASAIYLVHGQQFQKIADELTKRDDFSKAKALRMAAMAQLQNYAQQLSAITTAATGTWIVDDANAASTNVIKLLTDQKAAKVTQQQAGLIQTAVNDLAAAIISSITARKLQSLAEDAKKPISQIAAMVSQDNANIETDNYESGLLDDQQQAMLNVLHILYDDPSVGAGQRFAAIRAWQTWKPALVTKGKDISNAMANLTKANDALAAQQPISAGALAQQAIASSEQALGVSTAAK
jgi:hypothetical protein